MTWIDDLFTGIKRVLWEGAFLPQHQRINFLGTGVTVADNPGLGATDVTIEINLDDLDGDHINIDWDPTYYTPDASPPEAADENDLTAHLAGIDNELGEILGALEGTFEPTAHAPTHLPNGSDPLTTAAPVSVTKAANAAGSANSFSRSDHKHDVTTAAPSGGTEGTSTSLARADHTHPLPSLGSDDIANESGVTGTTVSEALDNLEAAIGPGSTVDAWPSSCALVFDFTKPATVAIVRSVLARDLADDFSAVPGYTPPPSTANYIRLLAPTSNAYPVEIGGTDAETSAERYLQTGVIPIKPGYTLIRVCAQAVGRSWIAVEFTGATGTAWFNLSTVATGTLTGAAFLDSHIESDGHAGCVCDILLDAYTTGGTLQIYVCDADGALTSETPDSPVTAIRLLQFDVLHETAGIDVFQQTVERIESSGSRRTTCAWQDENEASQPPLITDYTPLLPTAGALFLGDHGGLGINSKYLRILDPAGAYDLVRQLSAPGAGWTLYVVCTKPDDDADDRPLFNLGATTVREVSALFYSGDVILRDRDGGTVCAASMATPVADGMHLFAFYHGGRTLRVGVDDTLSSIALNTNICDEPFTMATLGGTGTAAFIVLKECRALMQIAIFVPEKCDPLSTDDTAIRAKLATGFSVTTLLGT